MPQQIQEIMTKQIHEVGTGATIREAARLMRDQQIGDVLITNPDGTLFGILTDRDIVVRADAEARSLDTTTVDQIASHDSLVKLEPTASVEEAVKLMREHAVRRVPVVRDGKPVGIVSIGDLAQEKDPRSALAAISSAAPTI